MLESVQQRIRGEGECDVAEQDEEDPADDFSLRFFEGYAPVGLRRRKAGFHLGVRRGEARVQYRNGDELCVL
jgi:hypothetical protein